MEIHIPDFIQRYKMPVKSPKRIIVESLLIVRFSIPAIVIAIAKIFLRLPVSLFRSHFIIMNGLFEVLLKPPASIIVTRAKIIHGGTVSLCNFQLKEVNDNVYQFFRKYPGSVLCENGICDLKRHGKIIRFLSGIYSRK